MLTNNYYRIMASVTIGASTPTEQYIKLPDGTTKVCTSSLSKCHCPFIGANFVTGIGSSGYANNGFCLGRGSTPPTKEDYALEDMITSGLSLVTSSVANQWGDNGFETIWSYTLHNTSDADITICEVGKIGMHYSGSASINSLMDRTVLSAPITIPAGGTKVLSHSIRINYPA